MFSKLIAGLLALNREFNPYLNWQKNRTPGIHAGGINDKHRFTLHFVTNIDQQRTSHGSSVTPLPLNPHHKKDLMSNPIWLATQINILTGDLQ